MSSWAATGRIGFVGCMAFARTFGLHLQIQTVLTIRGKNILLGRGTLEGDAACDEGSAEVRRFQLHESLHCCRCHLAGSSGPRHPCMWQM